MEKPSLDTASVVSILVSASFLKVMEDDREQRVHILILDFRPGVGVSGVRLQEHEPHPDSDSHLQLCGGRTGEQAESDVQTLRDREPLGQEGPHPGEALHQDGQPAD